MTHIGCELRFQAEGPQAGGRMQAHARIRPSLLQSSDKRRDAAALCDFCAVLVSECKILEHCECLLWQWCFPFRQLQQSWDPCGVA